MVLVSTILRLNGALLNLPDLQSFPYSVSPEHGRSIGISAAYCSEALGGDFDELLLNFDRSMYLNNPWFDHHVLSMRLRGALALEPDYEETFLLGGMYGNSLFTATTARIFPFLLEGIHGALFLEGGNSFGNKDDSEIRNVLEKA